MIVDNNDDIYEVGKTDSVQKGTINMLAFINFNM